MRQNQSDMEQTLGVGSRVRHPAYGEGVIIGVENAAYMVSFIKYGIKPIGKNYKSWEIIEAVEPQGMVSFSDPVEIADKWIGGTLVLQPGSPDLKSKEIPIDTFFHKIVMLRERLRVLEQRINNHPKLNDADRVNLQQYITRIYGTLTTFNVLFKHKKDHFVGEKSKG